VTARGTESPESRPLLRAFAQPCLGWLRTAGSGDHDQGEAIIRRGSSMCGTKARPSNQVTAGRMCWPKRGATLFSSAKFTRGNRFQQYLTVRIASRNYVTRCLTNSVTQRPGSLSNSLALHLRYGLPDRLGLCGSLSASMTRPKP
jgi:hypothetical protein